MAWTPNGLLADGKSTKGPGLNAPMTREPPMNAPMAQTIGRQRRESSFPSGNSKTRNKIKTTYALWAWAANHAATAPPDSVGPSGASATVAYCPENIATPTRTLAARKIQPITLPGRREEIRAPRVAKVGAMIAEVTS